MQNAPNTSPVPADPGGYRISLSAGTLSLIVAAVLMAAYNATFWSRGAEIFRSHPGQLIVFGLAIYALLVSFVGVFSFRPIVRPALAVLLIVSAVTSYYMDTLGVMIDRDMIQNVATTTLTESKHLLTFGIVAHVALFGLLPAAALFFVNVRRQRWLFALGTPVVMFVGGLAVGAGLLMTNYGSYASILRERKDFMGSFQPGAPLVGAVRYAKMVARTREIVVAPLGMDARKGPLYALASKPVLTIIVAGETARSMNFGLNGYERDTTPELAARDVVSFTDVSSCGTATAVSLPCMFSRDGRAAYSFDRGLSNENLLDVLVHAGFDVEWWDNNTGSKAVSARVPTRSFTNSENAEFCPTGECTDGIFMQHLAAFVPTITRDTVLVLHQIGSHGPTYHLRYPEGFAKFLPACDTAEFKDCSAEEIRQRLRQHDRLYRPGPGRDDRLPRSAGRSGDLADLRLGSRRVPWGRRHVPARCALLHGPRGPDQGSNDPVDVGRLPDADGARRKLHRRGSRRAAEPRQPVLHGPGASGRRDRGPRPGARHRHALPDAHPGGPGMSAPSDPVRSLPERTIAPRITGLAHVVAAAGYSLGGLVRLWGETAFRHEIVALVANGVPCSRRSVSVSLNCSRWSGCSWSSSR